MLLQFKIRNFRSIKDEVVIDLNPATRLRGDINNLITIDKKNYLSSLIIFGRNASGKSNIIRAFEVLYQLIYISDKYKNEEKITLYEPYKFDKECKNKPTEMEISYISNGIKFLYNVKFDHSHIIYESLYFYPNSVKALLFERNGQIIQSGSYLNWDKEIIENNILGNQLVLSKTASNNIKYLNEAYLFFKNMHTSSMDSPLYELVIPSNISQDLMSNDTYKKNIMNILKAADTNILDLHIKENPNSANILTNFPEDIDKKFFNDLFKFGARASHSLFDKGKQVGTELLDWRDESLGTRKLLFISSLILNSLKKGSLLLIDELDKSLHPLLTRMLIKLYHSKKNNPNGAQLIFASHDATLLDSDLFRRDQICFVEKGYEGNTYIRKLSDYKGVRKNIPYDKYYMSGQFKGIPVINRVEIEV